MRRHSRNGLSRWHVSADAASPPLPLHARPPRVGVSGEDRRLSNVRRRKVCRNDGRTWRAFCGMPGAQADQRHERACTDCRHSHTRYACPDKAEAAPIALPRAGWTRAAKRPCGLRPGGLLSARSKDVRASATERRRARSNLAQAGGRRRCSAAQQLQRVRPWFRWGWAWRLPLRRRGRPEWPRALLAPPPCRSGWFLASTRRRGHAGGRLRCRAIRAGERDAEGPRRQRDRRADQGAAEADRRSVRPAPATYR